MGSWRVPVTHGSVGVTLDGLHFQIIGLPSPAGYVAVIAKYVPCRRGGPWRRPSSELCRVTREYGPLGVEDAALRGGISLVWDPSYGASMPYLEEANILWAIDPWAATVDVYRRGSPIAAATAKLSEALGIRGFGLTGSTAMGIEVEGHSDLDLVVDQHDAPKVYEAWMEVVKPVPTEASEGGVVIGDTLEWRRGYCCGLHVSWIGVPREPAAHCKPLKRYPAIDPPARMWRGRIKVEPLQPGALLYPPCVETIEGLYLVSYEYNAARLLYEGGDLIVEGVASSEAIYLGARPNPGKIARARS